jgi:hypothetical protein
VFLANSVGRPTPIKGYSLVGHWLAQLDASQSIVYFKRKMEISKESKREM